MISARKYRCSSALQRLQTALLALLLVQAVHGAPATINLSRIGTQGQHGVSVYFSDGAVSNILVDTVQYQFGVLRCSDMSEPGECQTLETLFNSPAQEISNPGSIRLDLDVRDTAIFDCVDEEAPCPEVNASVSLTSPGATEAWATVPITLTDQLTVGNLALHPINDSHGVLGMGYKAVSSSSSQSAFVQLLHSATNGSNVFGLDLQPDNSSVPSTLQLGGVAAEYENMVVWSEKQLRDQPVAHTLFLDSFSVCGVSIFGNWSNNWEVKVDAASTCLVLPEEFYDTVVAWLPVNLTDSDGHMITDDFGQPYAVIPPELDGSPLPPFKLRMSGRSGYLYIALTDLLLPSTVLKAEFQGLGSPLCVIKGNDIIQKGVYSSTAPPIVFGARVLQSLYFAADMEEQRVGFANKHDPAEMETLVSTGVCMPQATCVGFQKYSMQLNRCRNPGCSNYYFMRLNEEEKACEWKPSAIAAGIFIVTALAVCELVVYLVTQYSLSESTTIAVDPVTWQLGRWATKLFDDLLLSLKPELQRRTVPAEDAQ